MRSTALGNWCGRRGGDDLEDHVEELRQVRAAGFDEVYVSQIGPEQDGFFRFYAEQVLPKVR
ncbi:MAG TPA: hypothetical protein VFZ32_06795 [Micromonosporaceae bacterium]